MQRLTWYGVALHAGNLPGYPASHGCIRLPAGFAKLLYGATKVGMTVVISEQPVSPRIAPAPELLPAAPSDPSTAAGEFSWHPEKAPQGPVSIVISAADRKAIVLRNGVEIGAADILVEGPVPGTWAYALRKVDTSGQQWIRVSLSSEGAIDEVVPSAEWRRFHAPEDFRRAVASIIQPGTTVVVTSDSLTSGALAAPVTVIDAEAGNHR